jgi:polygalacturonase
MHGFAIGSELSGGMESVYVYDIHMEYIWAQALSLKSCPGRGGVIRDIHVGDITIDKVDDHAISIVSEYPGSRFGEEKTCYRDMEFHHIHCSYAKNGLYLEGSAEIPLENILLEDVTLDRAEQILDAAQNTGSTVFRHVSINGSAISLL